MEEVEEGNCDKVGDSIQVRGPSVVGCYCSDGQYWQGQLWLCGWVIVTEMFDQTRDGEIKGLLGGGCSSGVWMSVQNILLCNVPESPFDRLNLDLISKAVPSFPHSNSKRKESVCVCCEVGRSGSPVKSVVVLCPRFPPAVAFGPIHHGSFNRFPCRVSKTLDFTQGGVNARAQG